MESKNQEVYDRMMQRKKEVKMIRKIVAAITFMILLCSAIVGIAGYLYVNSALDAVNPDAKKMIKVEIPMGSGINTIAATLESAGLVKNAQVFKYYAKFKNEAAFQAGTYELTQAMTIDEIIKSLKSGVVYREPVLSITIPEGLTLEQISKVIEKKSDFTADEFMKLVTDDQFISKMMTKYPNLITKEVQADNIRYELEGYLYPATYPFYEGDITLAQLVETMIRSMDKVVASYKEQRIANDMTVHELLTFSSLLEEEATSTTDRETIASVFYNRLDTAMPLQTDPTVLYALGGHKARVLYEDLRVANPYNTYTNTGLPPGPIAAPGKVSIEAALNPTETGYFYFLADKKGINHFSKTYEEHLAKVEKYLR